MKKFIALSLTVSLLTPIVAFAKPEMATELKYSVNASSAKQTSTLNSLLSGIYTLQIPENGQAVIDFASSGTQIASITPPSTQVIGLDMIKVPLLDGSGKLVLAGIRVTALGIKGNTDFTVFTPKGPININVKVGPTKKPVRVLSVVAVKDPPPIENLKPIASVKQTEEAVKVSTPPEIPAPVVPPSTEYKGDTYLLIAANKKIAELEKKISELLQQITQSVSGSAPTASTPDPAIPVVAKKDEATSVGAPIYQPVLPGANSLIAKLNNFSIPISATEQTNASNLLIIDKEMWTNGSLRPLRRKMGVFIAVLQSFGEQDGKDNPQAIQEALKASGLNWSQLKKLAKVAADKVGKAS